MQFLNIGSNNIELYLDMMFDILLMTCSCFQFGLHFNLLEMYCYILETNCLSINKYN